MGRFFSTRREFDKEELLALKKRKGGEGRKKEPRNIEPSFE